MTSLLCGLGSTNQKSWLRLRPRALFTLGSVLRALFWILFASLSSDWASTAGRLLGPNWKLIDWCIFILLSRESDGALCFGRIRTRLGVDHFPSFPVGVLTSSQVNLLLVRSHQAEIIIVKRLIQGRNNVTRLRVELMILRSESS